MSLNIGIDSIFNSSTLTTSHPQSHFLKLPAELRNRIYEYIYPANQTIYPYAPQQRQCLQLQTGIKYSQIPTHLLPQIPQQETKNFLALTLANKQIRSEVLPILISNTKFVIYHAGQYGKASSPSSTLKDKFTTFLSSLGSHIRHLHNLVIMVRRTCISLQGHPCAPDFTPVTIDFIISKVIMGEGEKGALGMYCQYQKLDLEPLRQILRLASMPGRKAGVTVEGARSIWEVFEVGKEDGKKEWKIPLGGISGLDL